MNNKNIFLSILVAFTIIMLTIGGTLAYWNWTSNTEQKTNVVFTVGNNFSCSADGGGDINTTALIPTNCLDPNYAIKRTITTNITNNGENPVYMDLWLEVNSIGEALSQSYNLKYVLGTESNSCTNGIIQSGNFRYTGVGSRVNLLDKIETGGTYYLYIWLDEAETNNNTQNQSISLSLGGECSNVVMEKKYYSDYLWDGLYTGEYITSNHTMYDSYGELAANETHNQLFAVAYLGSKETYWCIEGPIESQYYNSNSCALATINKYRGLSESDCNQHISNYSNPGNYTCTESQIQKIMKVDVGFVYNNVPYYLAGINGTFSYQANKTLLDGLFGVHNENGSGKNLMTGYNMNLGSGDASDHRSYINIYATGRVMIYDMDGYWQCETYTGISGGCGYND